MCHSRQNQGDVLVPARGKNLKNVGDREAARIFFCSEVTRRTLEEGAVGEPMGCAGDFSIPGAQVVILDAGHDPSVVTAEKVVEAKDGSDGLSKPYLPTSSAAICWASAAEPPLPHKRILLPDPNAVTQRDIAAAMWPDWGFNASTTPLCASNCSIK